jgi:hypothetical protein
MSLHYSWKETGILSERWASARRSLKSRELRAESQEPE